MEQANIAAANYIQFPNIDPVIFKLGFLELRWYSLAYLMGILLGWFYIMYLNRKHANNQLTPKILDSLPTYMILSIVLGGRLGYVLFYNLGYYLENMGEIFAVWKGGMSFHGGLIGSIIGMGICARAHKINYFKLSDLVAAATPIGLCFGRISNFINGELYGRITDSKWGVIFPGQYYPRHASQLYEAVLEGLVLFIILSLAATKFNALKRTGLISALFLMLYSIFRFSIEFFREADAQIGYFGGYFTMGMFLCVPMFITGAAILVWSLKQPKAD